MKKTNNAPPKKSEAGRLPSYRERYCEEIIELTHKGRLNTYEIAFKWGVSANTLYDWCKSYPDFRKAYDIASTSRRGKLVRQIEGGMNDKNFNSNCAKILQGIESRNNKKAYSPLSRLTGETSDEMTKSLLKELRAGRINEGVAHKVIGILSTASSIEEMGEVRKKLDALQEQLLAKNKKSSP